MLKIVIDDKIPYIREAIAALTPNAVYLPGAAITAADVKDADALIVRTRTKVNAELLEGSKVSFVGTATIGHDHIDRDYMQQSGRTWMSCPGCNATAVSQYVTGVLRQLLIQRYGKQWHSLACEERYVERSHGLRIGIVGMGHVGCNVDSESFDLGFTPMPCDPLLKEKHPTLRMYRSMEELARECDVITFHVPLTTDGPYPTYHMANKEFFSQLRRKPLIINTSRGGVVDEQALLEAMANGTVSGAVIDTWENEPNINRQLLQKAWMATPHIAGYSVDGKVNASRMVIGALSKHFNLKRPRIKTPKPPFPLSEMPPYNPQDDSQALKDNPSAFEQLRNNYQLRWLEEKEEAILYEDFL